MDPHTPTVTVPSTSVKPRLSQRLMPTMLAPMDIPEPTMVSMVTVDTPPPHTHMLPPPTDTAMDTPAQLTPMVTVPSTSVMPRLSQRLMPTMLAPMDILEPTTVSMVTVDMLPPPTDIAMDTPAQLTPTVTVPSTSVMPRLSQ